MLSSVLAYFMLAVMMYWPLLANFEDKATIKMDALENSSNLSPYGALQDLYGNVSLANITSEDVISEEGDDGYEIVSNNSSLIHVYMSLTTLVFRSLVTYRKLGEDLELTFSLQDQGNYTVVPPSVLKSIDNTTSDEFLSNLAANLSLSAMAHFLSSQNNVTQLGEEEQIEIQVGETSFEIDAKQLIYFIIGDFTFTSSFFMQDRAVLITGFVFTVCYLACVSIGVVAVSCRALYINYKMRRSAKSNRPDVFECAYLEMFSKRPIHNIDVSYDIY